MPARERSIRYLPLADVLGAVTNPKNHDRAGIQTAISEHGLAELPLLDERTGRLVAGHGRIEDLRARQRRGDPPPADVGVADDGEWLVPVQAGWASRDDAHAAAYLIASNRLSENGGWDDDQLPDFLQALAADNVLELSGFTQADLDALLDTGDGAGDNAGAEPDREPDETYRVVVMCSDSVEQQELYEQLKAQGYACAMP